jgi:hypothetical protein
VTFAFAVNAYVTVLNQSRLPHAATECISTALLDRAMEPNNIFTEEWWPVYERVRDGTVSHHDLSRWRAKVTSLRMSNLTSEEQYAEHATMMASLVTEGA